MPRIRFSTQADLFFSCLSIAVCGTTKSVDIFGQCTGGQHNLWNNRPAFCRTLRESVTLDFGLIYILTSPTKVWPSFELTNELYLHDSEQIVLSLKP